MPAKNLLQGVCERPELAELVGMFGENTVGEIASAGVLLAR